jgi:chemotaxis protein methyltransferase CheR
MSAVESSASERFRLAIARSLGLHFDDSKRESLVDLLRHRLDRTSLPAHQYLGILESGCPPRTEIRELARHLTVGETYFFRNSEQFNALRDHVLPERVRAAPERQTLRILSAGCATGEEPYSIAILIEEMRDLLPKPVEIVGVDINETVIAKAREARYSRWSLRGVAEARIERWFVEEGRDLKLDERIRSMVRFEEGNLLEDDPSWFGSERYDVVFCRNLLMYLTPEAGSQVVDRLTRTLVPGGYLFLGHAETLRGLTRDFHLHHTHQTFYYQRKLAGEVVDVQAATPSASVVAPLLVAELESAGSWVEAISRASERVRNLVDRTRPSVRPASSPAAVSQQDLSIVIELLRRERYDDALAIVNALPFEGSRNPDVLTLRAVLLAHRGSLGEAEEACRDLLSSDELNAGAHYLMALCREGAVDRGSAVDHDQMAIHLDPGFAAPRLHLGLLEKKAGHRFEARNHLALALVLLEREEPSRLLFFGGGFSREALIALCRAELVACGGTP